MYRSSRLSTLLCSFLLAVITAACAPIAAPGVETTTTESDASAETSAPLGDATSTDADIPAETEASAAPAQEAIPRVFFVDLADGDTVSSPFDIQLGVENLAVEGDQSALGGITHLHIIVDEPCVAAGEEIPHDFKHFHYPNMQMEVRSFRLTRGSHTLCLQAGDGKHIALAGEGMTHVVQVTVE